MEQHLLKARILICLYFIIASTILTAQCTEYKLLDPNAGVADQHRAVKIYQGQVLTGAYRASTTVDDSGKAFLWEFDGTNWNETVFMASDPADNDHYGFQLGIYEDRIAIGAPRDDDNGNASGSIYIYDWDGSNWIESKLLASNGNEDDELSVGELIGDRLVAQSREKESAVPDVLGMVYVFDWDGSVWNETDITLTTTRADDEIRSEARSHGDRIVIGVDAASNNRNGAVVLLEYDGANWIQTEYFEPPTSVDLNYYGWDVDIYGDRIVVGCANDDDLGTDAGAVYIYEWDNAQWNESKLLASDGVAGDNFGNSVSINGDLIVVGANDKNGTGGAYLYEFDGTNWIETIIDPSDSTVDFGTEAEVAGDIIAVSDWRNGGGNFWAGAVYLYDNCCVSQEVYYQDLDGDGYGDPSVSMVACGPDYGYVGNDMDCNDSDATLNPNSMDICNDGIDNNCNGMIDENCFTCTGSNLIINSITQNSYSAEFTIESDAVINQLQDVLFQAGTSVELTSGFEATTQGNFTAIIGTCIP